MLPDSEGDAERGAPQPLPVSRVESPSGLCGSGRPMSAVDIQENKTRAGRRRNVFALPPSLNLFAYVNAALLALARR